MPYKVSNKKSAFTLVELAIVIVVLGILVGGVLTGQSIIDSAKRSATVSHITQMKTALNAFKLEFDDIPGDMRDAYDYFGDECGDNSQDDYTGCNGNGDKCVGNQVGYCEPRNNQYWGDFRRFAIHLNLSNIYPDIAMDTDSTDGDCLNITPKADNDSAYIIYTGDNRKFYLAYFDLSVSEYASFCWLGNVSGQGAFSIKFAKSIDDKIDDGRGDRGKVRASNATKIVDFSNYNDGCLNNDGTYNLNRADQKNCKLRSDLY